MPGRYSLTHSASALSAHLGVPGCPATAPRRNIAPGDMVLALSVAGWAMMRWGIIPVGRRNARGRPVMATIINARSETVFAKSAFAGVGRAIVPASGWYEWTGEKRRKTAWEFTRADGEPILFAAIRDRWRAPGGEVLDQVAIVTCPPSADVAPIHHRMGVILAPADVPSWLHGGEAAAAALAAPPPPGLLRLREAGGVDWGAP